MLALDSSFLRCLSAPACTCARMKLCPTLCLVSLKSGRMLVTGAGIHVSRTLETTRSYLLPQIN